MKQSDPTKEFIRIVNNIFYVLCVISFLMPLFEIGSIGNPFIYLGIAAVFGLITQVMDIN